MFYIMTNPIISLNGDKSMEVTMAEGYSEPGATARFSFKDISKHIEIDNQVNDHKVGKYKVTYTVTFMKKTATTERIVSVIDKEPPVIELAGGDRMTVRPGEKFVEPGVKATDDSDGDVSAQVASRGVVDRYNRGDYYIQYEVSDSYGNTAKATRTVTVTGDPVKEVKGVIYLTFDDSPSNTVTPMILDTLEKEKVPATFFVIDYGNDSEKLKTLKRELKAGCTIGLHGYSHDYSKIYKSVPAFMDNINTIHDKVKEDLNYDARIMRFPGGSSNTVSCDLSKGVMTKLVKEVQLNNYIYSDWNVDSTDASGNNVAKSILINKVKESCDRDSYNIILMHDSDAKKTTAQALPEIIRWAKEEGYVFRAMTPDSPTSHHKVNN